MYARFARNDGEQYKCPEFVDSMNERKGQYKPSDGNFVERMYGLPLLADRLFKDVEVPFSVYYYMAAPYPQRCSTLRRSTHNR